MLLKESRRAMKCRAGGRLWVIGGDGGEERGRIKGSVGHSNGRRVYGGWGKEQGGWRKYMCIGGQEKGFTQNFKIQCSDHLVVN